MLTLTLFVAATLGQPHFDRLPKPTYTLGAPAWKIPDSHSTIDLSCDGKTFYSAGYDLKSYDPATGKAADVYRFAQGDPLRGLRLVNHPKGERVVRLGSNSVTIYDLATKKVIDSKRNNVTTFAGWGWDISANGRWMVLTESIDQRAEVNWYDLDEKRSIRVQPEPKSNVRCFVAPDGQRFATLGVVEMPKAEVRYLSILEIWSHEGKRLFRYNGTNPSHVCFSPKGTYFAVVEDKKFILFNATTGKAIDEANYEFPGDGSGRIAAFTADESRCYILSSNSGSAVSIDVPTLTVGKVRSYPWSSLPNLKESSTGRLLAYGKRDRQLILVDLAKDELLLGYQWTDGPYESIDYQRDKRQLTTLSTSALVDWTLGDPIKSTKRADHSPTSKWPMPGYGVRAWGTHTYIAPTAFGPAVWDRQTGERLAWLDQLLKKYTVTSFRYSPDPGKLVAQGPSNTVPGTNYVMLIDLKLQKTQVVIESLPKFDEVHFAPSGQRFALFERGQREMEEGEKDLGIKIARQPKLNVYSTLDSSKPLQVIDNVPPVFYVGGYLDEYTFSLFGQKDRDWLLLDMTSGQLIPTPSGVTDPLNRDGQQQSRDLYHVDTSSDGRYSIFVNQKYPTHFYLYEVASGSLKHVYELPVEGNIQILGQLDFFAIKMKDSTLNLYTILPKTNGVAEPQERMSDFYQDLKRIQSPIRFNAQAMMYYHPKEAVEFLVKEMKATAAVKAEPKNIETWIQQLNSNVGRERLKAEGELQKVGLQAREHLLVALNNPKNTVDFKETVKNLLIAIGKTVRQPSELQAIRAIEVLERIGSPQAVKKLEELAAGDESWSTHHARQALMRLRSVQGK